MSVTTNKAAATVTLGSLTHTYDGTQKSASAATTPNGLTVNFVYVPDTRINAGSYAATATIDDVNYEGSASGTLVINKATPTVGTWPTASDITYGDTLADSTLSGGDSTPSGTFTFDAPGTAPDAGTADYAVTFTPDDTANYETVSGTVSVTTNKATPTVGTWPTASDITYGDTLGDSTLSGGSGSVSGTFTFDSPATAPDAGTAYYAVTFTPTDTANYVTVSGTVSVTANKATPVIAWNNPADISYGTALDATQLNASTGVDGTYEYNPLPGTVLGVGTHTLEVTFTPTDSANYNGASASVSINVVKAVPVVIEWPIATDITYGDLLGDSMLIGGSSSVPGTDRKSVV